MEYRINLKQYQAGKRFDLGEDFRGNSPAGESISFNSFYMEKNGQPFYPVSGEFHYSRMDAGRWEDELIKMRMGGINIVSTYLFWNHIEEEEGVFDFTGRRDMGCMSFSGSVPSTTERSGTEGCRTGCTENPLRCGRATRAFWDMCGACTERSGNR